MLNTFCQDNNLPPPPEAPGLNGSVLALLQHAQRLAAHLAPAADPAAEPLHTGDIAQLRLDADPCWGGMLIRICQTGWRLRGYLLVPHRGGCRDAWCSLKACELVRIGALPYPEAAWGFRHPGAKLP